MMANMIGSESFDIFAGIIQVPAAGMVLLPRLGRDFVRTQDIGIRETAVEVRTVQFTADLPTAANLANVAYPAIKSTIVTVEDSLGISYPNVKVLDVRTVIFKNVIESGGGTHMVEARWTLQAGEQ